MDFTSKTIRAIVAGTGFEGRAEQIRKLCKVGMPVMLQREPQNPHDADAIGVWIEHVTWFGLSRRRTKIGYIKAARADGLAKRLDAGEYLVRSAVIRSLYAPVGREVPRVSLEIEFAVIKVAAPDLAMPA